ncbi:MAG: tRNA lysidine(34) synthetase TilS [Acidimicrobiales bacterium]
MSSAPRLLRACTFPPSGTSADLAVSGGADSLGLLLLALEAGLHVRVHHVNHHARAASDADATFVRELCDRMGVACVLHDVQVEPRANFEARARAERRRVLPAGSLTGHTMDDLAETVVLNVLRGAGIDGLSPLVGDPTKPLTRLRRSELVTLVNEANLVARHDESNDDLSYRRNRVRHQLLPLMCEVAERDVVPLLARQAEVVYEDRLWLNLVSEPDATLALGEADCRELREWPVARRRRWLRAKLFFVDEFDDEHPPSVAELERAERVIAGEVVATELQGGRRLSRRGQRLVLEGGSTTLTKHG